MFVDYEHLRYFKTHCSNSCVHSSVWTAWIYMEKILCAQIFLIVPVHLPKLPKTISIWFTYAFICTPCCKGSKMLRKHVFYDTVHFHDPFTAGIVQPRSSTHHHHVPYGTNYESRKTWKKVTANSCGGCLNHVTAKKKSFMFVLFASVCAVRRPDYGFIWFENGKGNERLYIRKTNSCNNTKDTPVRFWKMFDLNNDFVRHNIVTFIRLCVWKSEELQLSEERKSEKDWVK